MAASSSAWVSVIVKRGSSTVVPWKIIKIGWDSNFGELLVAVDPTLANDTINKVCISAKDTFLDPVHQSQLHSQPVTLSLCFYLEDASYAALNNSVLLL